MLEFGRINQGALRTEPYKWAFIDELFAADNAEHLAATFPCDKFKKVAGYDGEKGYEYFSRSLIHMGASQPSHVEGRAKAGGNWPTIFYPPPTGKPCRVSRGGIWPRRRSK